MASDKKKEGAKGGGTLKVENILPGVAERFLSMWSLTGEIQDTPDFFAKEVKIDDSTTSKPRSEIKFDPNPDRYLWKATLTLSPSQFFLLPSDLEAAYAAVLKNQGLFDPSDDPLSMEDREIDYFLRRRPVDRIGRVLSGLTLTTAVSARPRVEGGETLSPTMIERDRRVETFGVKVDPLSWFVTGSEQASAYLAIGSYAKAYKRGSVLDKLGALCKSQYDSRCLEEVAGLSRGKRWAMAILPVFEYKSIDQFDFVRAGSVFVTSPLFDRTIESYTATWDLKRLFRNSKERLGAISAIRVSQEISAPAPAIEISSEAIPIASGELVYLKFRATGGIKDLVWSVQSNCPGVTDGWALQGVFLEKGDGLLSGYPEGSLEACKFVVSVTDAVGRDSFVSCELADVRGR